MVFQYQFPRPTVTVDTIVLQPQTESLRVLLIRRGNPPFSGSLALPGGFLDMDEAPKAGALRELEEETGLHGLQIYPLFTCGQLGRDPRGRCITIVFGTLTGDSNLSPHGGDDATEASWHDVFSLSELAFDHKQVLAEAVQNLQWQAKTAIIGRHVLPEKFCSHDLQKLYSICGLEFSSTEIRLVIKRANELGIIQRLEQDNAWAFCPDTMGAPDWAPLVW